LAGLVVDHAGRRRVPEPHGAADRDVGQHPRADAPDEHDVAHRRAADQAKPGLQDLELASGHGYSRMGITTPKGSSSPPTITTASVAPFSLRQISSLAMARSALSRSRWSIPKVNPSG